MFKEGVWMKRLNQKMSVFHCFFSHCFFSHYFLQGFFYFSFLGLDSSLMIQPPPLFLIVMAGGSGTRFWPKSTSKKPKQFLNFGSSSSVKTAASNDSHSLLSQTLKRFEGWIPESRRNYHDDSSLTASCIKRGTPSHGTC